MSVTRREPSGRGTEASRGTEPEKRNQQGQEQSSATAVDAIRHVGPTLEAEGRFIPTGDLPENQIANQAVDAAVDVRTIVAADRYDREAEAMGAERLRTRLPGDTSSDPHTDVGPENATNLDDDRRNHAA